MTYVHWLQIVGAAVSLTEYRDLAAINRDDLVLWKDAEAQRLEDKIELAKKEAARSS